MASYNLMRAADRARARADCQAEIDAVEAGQWPRDINDSMRWIHPPTSPYLPADENRRIAAEYAARMCRAEIEYLDGVDRRIAEGDPDLAGWEA